MVRVRDCFIKVESHVNNDVATIYNNNENLSY